MLQYFVLLTSMMHFLLVFKLQIALLQPLSLVTFSSWPYYSWWLYDLLWIMLLRARQQCTFMFSLQHNSTYEMRTRYKHAPDMTPRCSDPEMNGWLL